LGKFNLDSIARLYEKKHKIDPYPKPLDYRTGITKGFNFTQDDPALKKW
jgi:hypothetical protein